MSDHEPDEWPTPYGAGPLAPPLTTTMMRDEYESALCNDDEMTRVNFPGPTDPNQWALLVERHTAQAWTVFAGAMRAFDYLFEESAGGTYNCRMIAGTSSYSLHSYGLALDLNPSKNGPQGTSNCDQPEAFIDAAKTIATNSGRRCFMWGGDWPGSSRDPMHYQIGATKDRLATGVVVVGGGTGMPTYKQVLNVPDTDWAKDVIDDGIATGVINTTDNNPDDWAKPLQYGDLWTILDRLKWPKGTKT